MPGHQQTACFVLETNIRYPGCQIIRAERIDGDHRFLDEALEFLAVLFRKGNGNHPIDIPGHQHPEDVIHIGGGVQHEIQTSRPELLLDTAGDNAVKGIGQNGILKALMIPDDNRHKLCVVAGPDPFARFPFVSHFVDQRLNALDRFHRYMPGLPVYHVGNGCGTDACSLSDLLDCDHASALLNPGKVTFYLSPLYIIIGSNENRNSSQSCLQKTVGNVGYTRNQFTSSYSHGIFIKEK